METGKSKKSSGVTFPVKDVPVDRTNQEYGCYERCNLQEYMRKGEKIKEKYSWTTKME